MGEELAIRRRDCLRCHKPKLLCICSWLGRIQHRTEVTILQDHRELKHAVGTSRLLRLGLGACSEYRVWRGKPLPDRALEDLQRADAILFPADDSQDLEEFISAKPLEHLVVLDGTWAQAKAMYKAYRPLRELPAVKLKLTVPGAYRLRKSQKEYYRSTVEAVWQALKVLEPENESLDKLLTWFERLQLEQERVAESRGVNPRSKIRRRPSHKVSRMLRERFSDLVAVYGEFFRFPNMGKDLVLAFICAYRFRDREVFHKFIRFTPHGSDFSALPLEHLKMFEPELDGAFS
ncbi:MAG: tRNA-uridine aminocarboxypropyltransferase, partial [Myxococcota bacterium]|nr:tRNA-uridine aminocarboxypropyltransferase [Myxococcota bacterium]